MVGSIAAIAVALSVALPESTVEVSELALSTVCVSEFSVVDVEVSVGRVKTVDVSDGLNDVTVEVSETPGVETTVPGVGVTKV